MINSVKQFQGFNDFLQNFGKHIDESTNFETFCVVYLVSSMAVFLNFSWVLDPYKILKNMDLFVRNIFL